MTRLLVFIEAFLALSFLITLSRLATDTGGGDYFFTLLAIVIAGAILPYVAAMGAMARTRPSWSRAIGVATVIFGVLDVVVRTQAFFFPTDRSGGGMALWLPVASLIIIPLLAAIAHTVATVFGADRALANP